MDTYKVFVECTNCGESYKEEIGRGMQVNQSPCRNCGCYTIHRTTNPRDKFIEDL